MCEFAYRQDLEIHKVKLFLEKSNYRIQLQLQLYKVIIQVVQIYLATFFHKMIQD